jgi:hypothetical protein
MKHTKFLNPYYATEKWVDVIGDAHQSQSLFQHTNLQFRITRFVAARFNGPSKPRTWRVPDNSEHREAQREVPGQV